MSRVVPVLSAAEAVELIHSGATVSVSSSSGLGCPDDVLRALGERFATTGEAADLTLIHPIAAGDMYGIDGIDHLVQPGQIRRVIAGSYPSGPSSMKPPRIIDAIESNAIEAYNVASGILFQLHRAAAVGQPGVLTEVGLDTFMDPRRHGGRMNAKTTDDIVSVVDFDGREWLYFRSIPVDVAIIRATTADEFGNLTTEDEGAPLGVLDQALAAHNNGGLVIAQVKRLAEGRTLPAQSVRVPGIIVDAIVLAPDQLQTTQTALLPEAAGQFRAPSSSLELAGWGPEKVIARRAAMELRDGEAVNLGFGISALVPRILLEEGLDGSVTWVIEQGAIGGVPFLGFAFGCAQNPDALLASPDQFQYLQGGGFDRAMLSFLEVDATGSVNVSRLATRPHVTAGVGGFVDITARAKRIVFSGYFTAGARVEIGDGEVTIVKEGKHQRFVPEVQHVTFSGRRARDLGQEVVFITERCVIRLLPEGLTVTEIAPGVSLERDVVGQTSLELRISPDLREMDARLFRPDPFGLQLAERRA
ncbi:MAG: acyl CoA:acetate/3-ketoacid CoA transferase [Chloroflexota bacterium]